MGPARGPYKTVLSAPRCSCKATKRGSSSRAQRRSLAPNLHESAIASSQERTYSWKFKMGTGCPCVENDGSIEPKSLGQNGYGWSGDPIVLLTAPHAVYRNKQFTATLQSHYWARCEPPAILDKSGSEKTSEHVFQTLLITPEDSAPWKSASRSSAKLCLSIP